MPLNKPFELSPNLSAEAVLTRYPNLGFFGLNLPHNPTRRL
jgi:hypothetical protein